MLCNSFLVNAKNGIMSRKIISFHYNNNVCTLLLFLMDSTFFSGMNDEQLFFLVRMMNE